MYPVGQRFGTAHQAVIGAGLDSLPRAPAVLRQGDKPRRWACVPSGRARSRFGGGKRADGHVSRREASGRDSAGEGNAPMGMCPVGKSERARFGGRKPCRWACVPSGRARARFGGGKRADGHVSRREASGRDSAGGKPVRDRAGVRRWACVPSGRASGRDSAGETRRWACVPSGSEQAYFRAPWRFSSAARMTSSG